MVRKQIFSVNLARRLEKLPTPDLYYMSSVKRHVTLTSDNRVISAEQYSLPEHIFLKIVKVQEIDVFH